MKNIIHPLQPIYNQDSKILILGSFPSVKSRENNFYYAHPQNRFWQVLESVYKEKIKNKTIFLLEHNIALWDVIKSCEISGSSDSSIKNVVVNDIKSLIKKTNITKIYVNGKTAFNLYKKYLEKSVGISAIYLPSTSPANARYSLNDLVLEYRRIKNVDTF